MIANDASSNSLVIENNTLRCRVDCSSGLRIAELSNRFGAKKSNLDRELISIDYRGTSYTSADFVLKEVKVAEDNTRELATVLLENTDLKIAFRVNFISDKKDTLNILIQMADYYKDGVPYDVPFRSPFLADLEYTGVDDVYYYPACSAMGSNHKNVIRPVRESFIFSDIKLPLVITDPEGRLGFSVRFPSLSDLDNPGASQNCTMLLNRIANRQQLKDHLLYLTPDQSFNDCAEFEIVGLQGGWVEAFDRYRTIWQSGYNFSEYDREDLHWFNDCVVHNFTFLYGRESFDAQKTKVDVDKLLKDGEDYGGYDTVTVWNQYPRLGVDRRSQWDFYDDFPGGREALKKMVKEFHDKGVYVFMPYIPWDQGYDESTNSMGTEFAKLLADTDADGYQLDTLNQLPESFREKLDKVRPGIILTSQFHPMKGHAIEMITTSWEEFWDIGCMPEMDVLRFLFPRHIAPVGSRWYRKENKDALIQRAKFGAQPILIWQDIFGRWLPFSADQKAAIKEWKQAYLAHRTTYQCLRPIPLYPVKQKNIYCNIFRADDGGHDIYSLYNDSDEAIEGDILNLLDPGKKNLSLLIGSASFQLRGSTLTATLPPRQVVHIGAKSR